MFSLMVRKLRRQLRKLDNASPQQPPHISDSNSSNKLDVPTTNNKILKKSPSEGMKDSLGLKGITLVLVYLKQRERGNINFLYN